MQRLRWVSWAAVSSEPQAKPDKISIDEQLASNRRHIERHNGDLVTELLVPGQSRSIILLEDACRQIEAYAQLRQMIEAKSFDVLCFLDRSRLGRKASLSMAITELCTDAGIYLYETSNPSASLQLGGHANQLVGAIMSVEAAQEIERLKYRHNMGTINRARQGKIPGGQVPYGYKITYAPDGSQLVEVDEPAAKWIRQIFDWYLAGMGMESIAMRLNAAHVAPARAEQWEGSLIRSILEKCWRYAGYTEINRQSKKGREYIRAKGNWVAIVPEEVVTRYLAEKAQRQNHRRLSNTPYLLSGVIWCIKCNRRMSIQRNNRANFPGNPYIMVSCRNNHPKRYITYNNALAGLREAIEALSTLDIDIDEPDNTGTIEARIAERQNAIERIQAAILKADDNYIDGTMDEQRYRRQIERLQGQLTSTQAELNSLAAEMIVEASRGSRRIRIEEAIQIGLAMLDTPDVTQANAWLREHVKIWVSDNTVQAVEWL